MLKQLFNFIPTSLEFNGKAVLAFTFFVLFITNTSCGKRKPPVPPVEKVSQRVDISGFQRGDQIILSWRMPARNASENSVLNIVRADIYRLAEPAASPLILSEEEFISQSTLIAAQPIKNEDFALQRITYNDTLEFAGQAARLRYALRLVNSSGQKAAFSNFLLIEPTAKIPVNPVSLSGTTSESAITLKWNAPNGNLDKSQPANLLGYNVYRSNSLDPARQTHEILSKSNKLKETVRNKWHTTLEFAPIIIALAHNYWQWLYLSRQNYYQFFDYLLSVNFVVWFVLLITGIIFGIISLKYGRSKSFAITALVVLAVNLILFIVPK